MTWAGGKFNASILKNSCSLLILQLIKLEKWTFNLFSSNGVCGKLILKRLLSSLFCEGKAWRHNQWVNYGQNHNTKLSLYNEKSDYFEVNLLEHLYGWDLGLSQHYQTSKLNSFLLYIVCISLGKKNHTGYNFLTFSFEKSNFGHRCEKMLPSFLWCQWTMVTIYMFILYLATLV